MHREISTHEGENLFVLQSVKKNKIKKQRLLVFLGHFFEGKGRKGWGGEGGKNNLYFWMENE